MFEPRQVKSVKSRQDTINQGDVVDIEKKDVQPSMARVQSHFLVPSEKLDKVTKRVIAPYAQIERKGVKHEEEVGTYLDINRFTMFLEETVDLDSLLFETAMVLKTVTHSSAEGKIAAAHVAATKEFLLLDDVERDRRFGEGLKWIDAKVALCMPVVKPDGECYAVLELYRTYAEPYDNNVVYTVVSVACWAGAAAHQAQARITLQKTAHLNSELRALLQSYFCDLASIDTMLTDMLAVVKSFVGAMRSSFYILDRDVHNDQMMAEMWDDGWTTEKTNMPRKKVKVNLTQEQSPAGYVARTGESLNVTDAYRDHRFAKEIDPTTGTVVRSVLVSPIIDKQGVIGVVSVTNKSNAKPFDDEDEDIFNVFISYCSLIVHFYNMQLKKTYHQNLNYVYGDLMTFHMKPCKHDTDELMESSGVVLAPPNFRTYDYHISEGNKEDMPGLVVYMYTETFADRNFDRVMLAEFALTILRSYRANPYHNAEHAFCFTHTMFMILVNNTGILDFDETAALMLAGLCHDLDHPGMNNNFLTLIKHPLASMYKTSMLEYHHYFLAKKIIEDKKILAKLSTNDQARIMEEIKYDILCTDLAVYFQIRAQLAPLIAEHTFDWTDNSHRRMLKGILMTTSDLSGCCKPFGVSKAIAESVYDEFYNQGDMERAMGYKPLSMMDRKRSINQPAEQIQFLSVVVLPCLMLLQTIFPNTNPLTENCRKTQEAWHEEIEIRGQKLWRQEESVATLSNSKFSTKTRSDSIPG
ncbi:cAMP and cAMP-inhibited cGMP 3',5'-cyclic phosphodiesterase 10A-like [Pectinophora gossypiella]|uniref:cAMP and cAMP-inhibited cGMP 3',5'-cyclic phosphodiesterase 10A-like n=1 Tax=Pectinophora gossypiella TaxID=13191 RepID=UPI00214DF155|nr:cAMP and cAMP-inhibited cGMP 3',5'-cyclic phosphodiesterase 10A-like [Pectinophora gossypiella]XP_049872718.1 cAMP and cAMP-inhibited cGMP 3',5'-cyclic phosphodiesterase 10A-like [Pectinophora gossypiella]